jgi:hypothetical protein
MDNQSPICFLTDWKVRYSNTLFYLVYMIGLILVLISIVVVLGFVLNNVNIPVWACVIIGGGIILALFRFIYRGTIECLRFCIIFHPEHLQIGRGLTRINIPYGEVEMIGFPMEKGHSGVGVQYRGYPHVVLLPISAVNECMRHLRERCMNAIYVDYQGREHFPPNPNRPDFSIKIIYRHYRRVTYASLASFVFLSSLFIILFVYFIILCMKKMPTMNDIINLWHLLLSGAGAITSWLVYRRYYRRLSYLVSKMNEIK